MKYAIIIPDGAADHPLEALNGQTPLQAADTPHLDAICRSGHLGTVATTPEGYSAGSDICTMSLLGYDPNLYHPGRAPLEAAAMGLSAEPGQWIFRCNLVTVIDGRMVDHSAGHVGSSEAKKLISDLVDHLNAQSLIEGLIFHPGVSYRNIMIDTTDRDHGLLTTTPPHDIPGQLISRYLPRGGPHAQLLQTIIQQSADFFAQHEINQMRTEMGESPVTHVWFWGQGSPRSIPSFQERFGLNGAMITAVDLLAGIAKLIGWDRVEVPNITGYHCTDYAAKGAHAVKALDQYDLVCVHIEAPDEASHQADMATKIASLESIDECVVQPVVEKLKTFGDDWRLLCLPDHYTCVETRKHDPTPPPFFIAGRSIKHLVSYPFDEPNANASDLHVQYGHELMEYFLRNGL